MVIDENLAIFSSLDLVLANKDAPWRLAVSEGEQIVMSGLFWKAYEYIKSFFTESHTVDLSSKLVSIVSKADAQTHDQRITIEKISKLISSSEGWISKAKVSLEKPSDVIAAYRQREDDLLPTPLFADGVYRNMGCENPALQSLTNILLGFDGIGTPTTSAQDKSQYLSCEDPICRSDSFDVTWGGHATVHLQVNGMNIMIDPSFNHCPPFYPRHVPPGISFDKMPLVDIVVISHNHEDHCDSSAIAALKDYQPHCFVPEGFEKWFEHQGYNNAKGYTWGEGAVFEREGKTVRITSVPAQHNSQRSLTDSNTSLWQGIVVEAGDKKVYIAGDTGYRPGLAKSLNEKFGNFDLVFLPIAPEREETMHLNAEHALIYFDELNADTMVPYHWGTFRQSADELFDAKPRLEELLEKNSYSHLKPNIQFMQVGERQGFSSFQACIEEKQKEVV